MRRGNIGWILTGTFVWACAATNDGDPTTTTGVGGSTAAGFVTSAGVGGNNFEACATDVGEAKLVPINLYIMFDKSFSMAGSKWFQSTAALQTFFSDPTSGGLRVALRFFPDTGCDDSCNVSACATPKVALGELTELSAPTDGHEDALLQAFADVEPSGGTPMLPALQGALQFASTSSSLPGEKTAVVLVTDGEPEGCGTSTSSFVDAANQARVNDGVLTFTIGLDGSDASLLNSIAAAGGTDEAIIITPGEEQNGLVAALSEIRTSTVACTYGVPEEINGATVNPEQVNVLIRPPSADAPTTIGQVPNRDACTDEKGGWYYDDPADPKRIIFCPSTCAAAQAEAGTEVELLFGCETVPVVF